MAVFGGGLLSFEVIGLDRVLAGLASVQDAVKDLRPFWKDIFAPKYFATVQDVFALQGQGRGAGGRFAGGRWAPLSPAYAAWKRRHFPGRTILVRTGRLRESVKWNGTGLGAGGIFEAEPGFAIAGTSVPYGRAHMDGRSNMPARPFLPAPDPTVFAPLLREWILRVHRTGKP